MSISRRDNCININLPDGRSVNICTKEGANLFILQGVTGIQGFAAKSPCTFFSQNLWKITEACDRIYQRKKKPTREEINMITAMYTVTCQLAENADHDVFDDIPVNEVRMFLDHVLVEIGRMTEVSSNWARTGNLKYHYEKSLLEGLMALLTQRKPARLAIEMDLFGTLAEFASAPSSMKEDAAEIITMIVANFITSTQLYNDVVTSAATAFARLESCGMLEQFIRLSALSPMSNPVILKCYDDLRDCTSLIEEKFTEDQPCGKACEEILGRSSLNRHPVVGKLRMIATFTSSPKEMKDGHRSCSKCNKETKVNFLVENSEESVSIFVQENYVGILKEIVKVSTETGKSKGDLLLELDFYDSDENGRGAPALQTPPKFKVAESKGYFDGSRPNENIDREILKDSYDCLTDNHLLVLVRPPATSGFETHRVRLQLPNKKKYLFSQETIDAATKAIQDGRFGQLSSLFGVGSDVTRHVCRALGGRPDDDGTVDLNTYLWDQLLSD